MDGYDIHSDLDELVSAGPQSNEGFFGGRGGASTGSNGGGWPATWQPKGPWGVLVANSPFAANLAACYGRLVLGVDMHGRPGRGAKFDARRLAEEQGGDHLGEASTLLSIAASFYAKVATYAADGPAFPSASLVDGVIPAATDEVDPSAGGGMGRAEAGATDVLAILTATDAAKIAVNLWGLAAKARMAAVGRRGLGEDPRLSERDQRAGLVSLQAAVRLSADVFGANSLECASAQRLLGKTAAACEDWEVAVAALTEARCVLHIHYGARDKRVLSVQRLARRAAAALSEGMGGDDGDGDGDGFGGDGLGDADASPAVDDADDIDENASWLM